MRNRLNVSAFDRSCRSLWRQKVGMAVACVLLAPWSSFVFSAERGDAMVDEASEALIEPCDPFSDSNCRGRVELGDGRAFEGKILDGQPNGRGQMFYANGDRFEGHFDQGARTGRGTYYTSDGSAYAGFWVRDRLNGFAEWRDGKGTVFQGPLVNHQPHGRGTMVFSNGDRYTGEIAMGLPHGQGVMVYGGRGSQNNGDRYEGRFERGQRQGVARYVWVDGVTWDVRCQMDRCEREGFVEMIRSGMSRGSDQDSRASDGRRIR